MRKTNEILIYKNGIIKFPNKFKRSASETNVIWEKLREDFTNWVSKVTTIEFKKNTTLLDILHWNEMPTWWINQLTSKDVAINNQWFKRLQVIYVLKYCPEISTIITDDMILKKTINLNFKNKKVTTNNIWVVEFVKLQFISISNMIKLIFSLLDVLKKKILLFGQKKYVDQNLIWFRTAFPANSEILSEGILIDRHIKNTPLIDKNYGFKSGYLVSLLSYQKDKKLNIFQMWYLIRSFEKRSQRKSVFIEAYLSFLDVFKAYYTTIIELYKLNFLYKEKFFLDLFSFNDLDLSLILIDHHRSSYYGFIQYNKLLSLSLIRFLEYYKKGQTIITYEEFLPHTRFAYFYSKKINNSNKFIAIQHTSRSRNKLFSYFRKSEFFIKDKNLGSNHMPSPDFYFVHGSQYKKILSEFYENKKIKVLGCLRNEKLFYLKFNQINIAKNIKEKISLGSHKNILIAPSLNDLEDILLIIDKLYKYKDININLRPHPATDKKHILKAMERINSKLKLIIIDNFSTYELICVSDLVICGNSTIAFEAAYFGVQSIRVLPQEIFPLYENDLGKLIPYINNTDDFIFWYEDFRQIKKSNLNFKKLLNNLSNEYYYNINGKVQERFWTYLKYMKEKNDF
jgi:hypothetical protein